MYLVKGERVVRWQWTVELLLRIHYLLHGEGESMWNEKGASHLRIHGTLSKELRANFRPFRVLVLWTLFIEKLAQSPKWESELWNYRFITLWFEMSYRFDVDNLKWSMSRMYSHRVVSVLYIHRFGIKACGENHFLLQVIKVLKRSVNRIHLY